MEQASVKGSQSVNKSHLSLTKGLEEGHWQDPAVSGPGGIQGSRGPRWVQGALGDTGLRHLLGDALL